MYEFKDYGYSNFGNLLAGNPDIKVKEINQ